MRLTFWTALVIFVSDQLSKYWILHVLDLDRVRAIDVLPPYLNFRMAWNTGINFGLFGGFDLRWILVGIALAVTAFVVWWIRREGGTTWTYLSAGLLIGGALGNVIDRVLYGAVADFLNMSCCGIDNPYAFNIADIAVFAGAIGLVIFTGEKGGTSAKKGA